MTGSREDQGVLLPPDAPFPTFFQGKWSSPPGSDRMPGMEVEIVGRSLTWDGRPSDFSHLIVYECLHNGKDLLAVRMRCAEDHPDVLNWDRYNFMFLLSEDQSDRDSMMVVTSKFDNILVREKHNAQD